ncbi:MAG: leucine-rich repeat protein, partial [Intestinibacter sp.]
TLDKLPDSIANIGEGAFEYCIGLKLTQLPSKLTSISDYSFRSCSKLALTALPDGIKTIGKNAFYGCTGLVEVSMPSELVSVDEYAFYSCTKLKTLTLPEGFNSIGNSGFGYCKAIETLNLPDSLTEIGDSAFYGDYGIVTLNMSDNVTRIGKKAFSYCMDMKLDELPDSLEIIDNNGFLMCENMTVSVLPESLVHIGNNAFNGCTNISIATIPASVNYIGHNSFIACTSMPEKLNVLAKVPPTLGADAFLDSSVTTICVPSESLDSYKADSSWSAYNIIAIDKALVNITFNLNNGEENIVKTVLAGSKVSYAPKAPVKKGYVFVGWYENVDNINTAYKNGSTYTKNVTYTAKYAHVQMLGAQVKAVANDMSGIRFGTRIYDDGDEIVEKGTLIIPVKVLGAGEALTLDTEKAARSVGKVNYEVNEQQNYVTYLGTIINIPRAQFDAEMTASAYVIYKDKAGNEYTVYSNYPNQSTSIKKLLGI